MPQSDGGISHPMVEFDTDIGGLRLRACQWGDPDLPPVLILHGWLDQAYSWKQVAEVLATSGRTVYALDQRGHGLSDHAPRHSQYHFVDYIADVDAWLIANDISTVSLIGHSMGGTVASLVAALCPKKVSSLILVEGLGAPYQRADAAAERYLKHLGQRRLIPDIKVFSTKNEATARLLAHHSNLSEEFASRLAARILSPCEGGWRWTWDQRHKHRSSMTMPKDIYAHLLAKISSPTLFIQGNRSHYPEMINLEHRLQWLSTPLTRKRIQGGHNLHFEEPLGVASIILKWWEGLS